MTAEFKLIVQLPATDGASQPSHKLTLSNEDGSYTKTLDTVADGTPGDTAGTSVLTFDGLTDGHTYSLHGEDDDGTYVLLDPTQYHEIATKLGGQRSGASADPSQPSDSPAADTGNENTAGTT